MGLDITAAIVCIGLVTIVASFVELGIMIKNDDPELDDFFDSP